MRHFQEPYDRVVVLGVDPVRRSTPFPRDRIRLQTGMDAIALPEPGTAEEASEQLTTIHLAICALQSMDDLGNDEANDRAMRACDLLLEKYRRLERLIESGGPFGLSGVGDENPMKPASLADLGTCTAAERLLVEAVVDYWLNRRLPRDVRLPYEALILDIIEERRSGTLKHPDRAQVGYLFLSLPWRRQIALCERLGLINDQDEPASGPPLFELIFPRVLERGALKQLKILIEYERDIVGLERRNASS